MPKTWKLWFYDAAERTARTFAQAFAASLVVTGVDDWTTALKVGAGAGVLAVATSLAARKAGSSSSASLLPKKKTP